MSTPCITALIDSYNQGRFIEEAIESNPDLVRRIKESAAAMGPRMSAEGFASI